MNTHRTLKDTRGAAMLITVLLLVSGSMVVLSALTLPVIKDVRQLRDFAYSKQSFYTAEAGVEDAVLRLTNGNPYSSPETLSLAGASATTSVAVVLDKQEVTAVGDRDTRIRKTKVLLEFGAGASFNYGLQSDVGGIHLKNTSSIRGNVFSNGPVTGQNSNIIRGDVISADSTGLIDSIHATGTAYANTITDSEVEGDAYYQTISGTTVGGTSYPDSPDQATSSLPISDEMIEEWKLNAETAGTYSGTCPYQIDTDTTLNSMKIPCDLQIVNDPTITLQGVVWVEGDITVQNTAILEVNSGLSGKTVPIIADDPSNPTSKGVIQIKNNTTFTGAGDGSYIMFISQNTSAESGGGTAAIEVDNGAEGDLLVYAAHGKITISNNVDLKEVTAYRIEAQNSAEVVYETGLANLLFASGPSGGFVLDDWLETE